MAMVVNTVPCTASDADVAAREEQRAHHVRVGAEREPAGGTSSTAPSWSGSSAGVAEGREEHPLDQRVGEEPPPPWASVTCGYSPQRSDGALQAQDLDRRGLASLTASSRNW